MSWGDDDGGRSPADDAVQEQISQNQAELEKKRQSLYAERLGILKTQGATSWEAPEQRAVAPSYGKPASYSALVDTALGQSRGTIIGKQKTLG